MTVLSTTEQRSRALVVLLAAAKLYRERRGTLCECVQRAAVHSIDAEYARRVLRGVLFENDVPGWEAHPTRRRADVWRVLQRAIRWCSRRAGGWRVGGRDRVAEAKVPATRQWLEWLPRVAQ